MRLTVNKFEDLYLKLSNGFFLSSMMGVNDGFFCSERSWKCVMVQLGAYLAEPQLYGKATHFLPDNPNECTDFFVKECKKVKRVSKAFICLNLATPKLEWGIEAAESFHKAQGNLVELNVHGAYEPYFRLGKLRAMVLPENRNELYRWVQAFVNLEIPLIVKFRKGFIDDYSPILKKILDYEIFGVHFNIRDDQTMKPDYKFVKDIKRKHSLFLLVSGFIRSTEDAKMLFEAGADMVGIAEPTIRDPEFIRRIVEEFSHG